MIIAKKIKLTDNRHYYVLITMGAYVTHGGTRYCLYRDRGDHILFVL